VESEWGQSPSLCGCELLWQAGNLAVTTKSKEGVEPRWATSKPPKLRASVAALLVLQTGKLVVTHVINVVTHVMNAGCVMVVQVATPV
jgi:hypothetical protein